MLHFIIFVQICFEQTMFKGDSGPKHGVAAFSYSAAKTMVVEVGVGIQYKAFDFDKKTTKKQASQHSYNIRHH